MKNNKINNTEYEIWNYLFKELAKINTLCKVYDKIFAEIEIKNNRYNVIFQIILDSLTRNIVVSLANFFNKRKDNWSLYDFNKIKNSEIDTLKRKAMPILSLRYNRFAHLNKNLIHKNNFEFLSLKGIKDLLEINKSIKKLLEKVNLKETYYSEFQGVRPSLENLLNDLNRE